MLLLRNVRIDAEGKGKLDAASLQLAAQLPISHKKLDTIEDEMEGLSLTRQTPNPLTSSREMHPLLVCRMFTFTVARLQLVQRT
jgi:hypothetical protein